MTIHISRDLHVQTSNIVNPLFSTDGSYSVMFLIACFLRGILNFTVVGNTGLDIDASPWLLGSGTTAGFSDFSKPYTIVDIDPLEYVVSIDDLGSILVLKSALYPRHNSGLYRVVNVDVNQNSFHIDFATPDQPKAESNISWRLQRMEAGYHIFNRASTSPTNYVYKAEGSNTCTRIILQSPHVTGWQVRLAIEDDYDDGLLGAYTIAPGFDGNSSGDFPAGGKHLHLAQWMHNYYSNSNWITPMHVGLNPASLSFYQGAKLMFWGDTETGSCAIVKRGAQHQWVCFGIPDDEEDNTLDPIYRLFVFFGGRDYNDGMTVFKKNFNPNGLAWCEREMPHIASLSSYAPLVATGDLGVGHFFKRQNAVRNMLSNQYDLLPLDVYSGVYDTFTYDIPVPNRMIMPRRMGQLPFFRFSSATYPMWCPLNDASNSWYHTVNGLWLPWSGPRQVM